MTHSGRRRFLAALGVGAWGILRSQRALAENASAQGAAARGAPAGNRSSQEPPLRFIGVYLPHGMAYELWKPGPGFDLRYEDSSLSPFDDAARYGRSYRDRLLVIDGLDLAAGIEVGTVGHDAARAILTGSGADGKNASLDQFLAVHQALGASTPVTSLTLGVGSQGTDLGANISYAEGGVPVPKLVDPTLTFDELFGKPLSAKERAALVATRRKQQSVLDWIRSDVAQLRARAPHDERVKLEQHLTALREIEKRLSPRPQRCSAPKRPDAREFPRLLAYGGGEPYFERITELQTDLLARAIACDLTRFATLFLADLSRTSLYPDLPRDVHAEVAHVYAPRDKGPGKPETWRRLALQNRHSYGHVVKLLCGLDDAGVIDDTLLYITSDMGDPARHSSRNVPTLLCGSTRAGFRMGGMLDVRSDKGSSLFPHNRLLVSLCQSFGVETQRFGHSASPHITTGALSGGRFEGPTAPPRVVPAR